MAAKLGSAPVGTRTIEERPVAEQQLTGQAALITGGGSGIGLASARALLRDGASVTLMGRTAEKLDAAAASLAADTPDGATVAVFAGDVTDEEQVAAAVAAASAPTGALQICVAAAGDGTVSPIVATSAEEWHRVIAVSLTGVFFTLKHASGAIAAAGGGAIVAVSSIAGQVTHRHMGPYNAAKAGVDMLVKTTADEMGAVGVRVNGVNPGIVATDLVAMITPEDEIGQSYLDNMPISRFGQVEDVAPAIRFLAGPESSWITGVCLTVDGGHHLRCGPDYGMFARMMFDGVVDPRILG
jgi:NAD(P)-dependent dehydrogenase (short-subunit alcohol dehydrogenase family)